MQTRRDILSAAITVFLKKGVAKATVHEIADEANLTRGAIYWHFDDKDDLVTAVFEEAINVIIGVTEEAVQQSGSTSLAKLKAFLRGPIEQAINSENVRNIYTVLMHYCDHGDEAANAFRLIFRAQGYYEKQLRHLLNEAIDDGFLRSDLDLESTIFMLMASMHGLTLRWLTPGQPIVFDLPAHLEKITDSLLLGLQHPTSNVTSITAGNKFPSQG